MRLHWIKAPAKFINVKCSICLSFQLGLKPKWCLMCWLPNTLFHTSCFAVCIFLLELRSGLVLACGLTSVAPAYFRCFRSFFVQVWRAPHMPSGRTRTLRLALPPVLWSHWQTSTPTTALWRYWSTPVVCSTHKYNNCISWVRNS